MPSAWATALVSCFNSRLREEATIRECLPEDASAVSTHASVRRRQGLRDGCAAA